MGKRILEGMAIGLCIAVVIGAILGFVYCYGRADNGGHNGNEMDTFGMYSGLCLDAAMLGVLAAVAFTLRRRPGWPSASGLYWGGGVWMLVFVGPIPGFQLEQTLENDAQGYLLMASMGCILLALVGAYMVILGVTMALQAKARDHIGPPAHPKLYRHCCPHLRDPRTCRWCGVDVKQP